MAYDRADWHYGGDFPAGLPPANGATHIGMFLAWAIASALEGERHRLRAPSALEAVRARRMTGRAFVIAYCDAQFTAEDLSEEGNAFTAAYYGGDDPQAGSYLADYEEALGRDLPSLYHVADTWENYDRIAPLVARRYLRWKNRLAAPRWRA